MNPRVAAARLPNAKLHQQVAIVDALEARIRQRCPGSRTTGEQMLDCSECARRPFRGHSFGDAGVAYPVVEGHVVVIERQVDFAIATYAHRDCVVFVQCLLYVVCESEVLPHADGGGNLATPEVDIMFAVACGRRIEGDILVVFEGR